MSGPERIYTLEIAVVRCPGDSEAAPHPITVRYCDTCHRWGASHTTHLCRQNWRRSLAVLLLDLAREARS
jgi:hypothetical protein